MNEWRSDERKWCFFHPTEMVVGICALCLKERLLLLAAAKKNSLHKTTKTSVPSSSSSLTKIFALTTLLNRLEIKHHKSSAQDHYCCRSSSSSQDDSFISMKFEDNGIATWEKEKCSKICSDNECDDDKKIKSLVLEHAKPRGTLRWRRRIGHIFQLIRLKRSNMCHVATTKHRKSKTLNTIHKM